MSQTFCPKLFLAVLACAALCGCVAPGSSIGNLSVSGVIVGANGSPIENEKIEIFLPATYGLGGLDRVIGKPADYGNSDEKFALATSKDGQFEHNIGDRVYHMSFWILPPLGGFPRRPPAPFIMLRLPDRGDEIYAVQTWDGRWTVLNDNGEHVELREAPVEIMDTEIVEWDSEEFKGTRGNIRILIRE